MRLALLVALLGLLPATVHAQDAASDVATPPAPAATTETPAPDVNEAQTLFRRAIELGDQNRWAEALELFRRSLALVPRPSTQFNVGFALFRLGHLREAIVVLDAYLAATEGETSELRAEALARRAEAAASLATVDLAITPGEATLRIDGEADAATGPTRTLSLDPGRHLLLATASGHEEAQLELSLLAGEHRAATLELALSPDVSDGDDGEQASRPIAEEPLFWAGIAVIAVAIGVGVGVGVALGTETPPQPYAGSTGIVLSMP